MRFPLLIILIVLVVNALVDLYIYCAVHSCTRRKFWHRLQAWSAVAFAVALVVAIFLPKRGGSDQQLATVMWILFAYFSIYIPKYIFLVFDVLSRLPMLWGGKRWRWMSILGAVVGVFAFVGMWWGALFDRYMIDINHVEISQSQLPQAFDGFKIAQISDLHLGSFGGDTAFVSKLVSTINDLHPDLIVFTGDIVNRQSDELKPYMHLLSRLNAPMGVYSILGNHDYGEYREWPSQQARLQDVEEMKIMQAHMGWKMLNNQTQWLHADGDSIALIGVENVGDPPFTTYGNLSQAYPNIADEHFKILLSHNPAHWVKDLEDKEQSNIALTLSGHTHAMQIMILGWSPAAWRYPTWGGLYVDAKGQNLYVNIGAGEVGFPARIGATPEITLFTLTR